LRADRSETGVSLVELSIAMAGLGVLAAIMLTLFIGATSTDRLHEADDQALISLRSLRERLSRDVREARHFLAIREDSFMLWIDGDWDGLQDSGELVSWVRASDGTVTRGVDGTSRVEAFDLLPGTPTFSFDSLVPSHVRVLTVSFVADVDAPTGSVRQFDFEVSLRNVP
jgi:hypothetical protein